MLSGFRFYDDFFLERISMSRIFSIIIAVLLIMLLTNGVYGQQLSDALRVSRQGLSFNAKALGMGDAYSTIGYDFSALLFNPATMAVTDKATYTMTVNANAFKTSSDYYGTHTDFTTTNTTGSQAGLTVPFHIDSTRIAALGLGYTQSKDFNAGFKYEGLNGGSPSFIEGLATTSDPLARALGLSYSKYDSSGNFLGDQTILGSGMYENGYLLDQGGMLHFTFGGSIEAVYNVFFGVSGSFNYGTYTSDLELSASDLNDVYAAGTLSDPGNALTNGFVGTNYRTVRSKQYTGWDIRFGILYKLENFIGISASFKLPTPHKVEEDIYTSGKSQYSSNLSIVVPESQTSSSYSFTPPYEATVGAMMNLWILTGTAEVSYVDYSQMRITAGIGSLPERTAIDKKIKDQLGPVVNLRGGAEFRLPFTGLIARAGFMYLPSPYKADPSKYSQKFLTAGFGINSSDMMQFDIGYAYGWRGELKNEQTDTEADTERSIKYHSVLFTMKLSL